jgi:hypothetical protein
MVEFQLSPLSDVELRETRNTIRRAEDVIRTHCKLVSEHHRDTGETLDYLALTHPSVKKTLQKREQRKRYELDARPTTLAELVARECVERWFELKKEQAENREHAYINRDRSIGLGGRYSGPLNESSKRPRAPKDIKTGMRRVYANSVLSIEKNHNAKTINLFEHEMIAVTKPSGLVPEPTPLISGWERGDIEQRGRSGRRAGAKGAAFDAARINEAGIHGHSHSVDVARLKGERVPPLRSKKGNHKIGC